MPPFVPVCLVFVFAALPLFLLGLLYRRVAPRIKGWSGGKEESEALRPVIEEHLFDDLIKRYHLDEKEEEPGFKFKFQFPEELVGSRKEEAKDDVQKQGEELLGSRKEEAMDDVQKQGREESQTDFAKKNVESENSVVRTIPEVSTVISNYNFLAKKDVSGFFKEPVATNFKVKESDVSRNFVEDSEELDRELRARLLSVKSFHHSDFALRDAPNRSKIDKDVEGNHSSPQLEFKGADSVNGPSEKGGYIEQVAANFVNDPTDERVDNKMTRKLFLSRDDNQSKSNVESEGEVLEDETRTEEGSKTSEHVDFLKGNRDFSKEYAEDPDIILLGKQKTLDRDGFLAESGFEELDLDFSSLDISSDGYSVKDLVVNGDTDDDFLTERDFVDSDEEHAESHIIKKELEDNDSRSSVSHDVESLVSKVQSFGSKRHIDSADYFEELEDFLKETPDLSQIVREASRVISHISRAVDSHAGSSFRSLRGSEQNLSEKDLGEHASDLEFTDEEVKSIANFELEASKSMSSLNLDEEFTELENDSESLMINGKSLKGPSETISKDDVGEPIVDGNNLKAKEKEEKEVSLTNKDANLNTLETYDAFDENNPKTANGEYFCDLGNHKEELDDRNMEDEENGNYYADELSEKKVSLDKGDYEDLESLWENQELMEQLSLELQKVRSAGLPTIHEDCEKLSDNLKSWKFDTMFLHENPMDELHTFYKSYRERTRKYDILICQKMYAIDCLQLKDPLKSMGSKRTAIAILLSQELWPCRRKKPSNEHSENFIKELRQSLETIYVAQMCLSWEFLWWQYEKSQELPESKTYETRQYNRVAGEFQQFQVLINRFLEDEPYQIARVPNYVKTKRVSRDFIQVPVIKEDCLKDKMEEIRKGRDAITIEELEVIMEKSIRIFWQFVKADKDESSKIMKEFIRPQPELQNPNEHKFFMEIQTQLQKKEKKLKDILRTGNCLVKKFKKPEEDRASQDLFFAQVDMKLVSRVLQMSRITTEQQVWCHNKLSKLKFLGRKIHRESSFSIFPCSI